MAAESHPEPALATVAAEDALATVAAEDALATGVVADEAAVRPKRPELPPGMSRNAFKKMLKDQKWVEGRGERREKRKRKEDAAKERKKQRIANGEAVPVSLPVRLMNDAEALPYRVAIDLQFASYMSLPDLKKACSQTKFCYSVNRRLPHPIQYHITSLAGAMREQLLLQSSEQLDRWDVHRHEQPYWDAFGKEEIVYLSSESENVLLELDPTKVYIIGGLVDHNKHKGLTHKMAVERGMLHAQLPIGQYLTMKSRKVLTINHVFEILARFATCKNWQQAFLEVLPQRKGATALEAEGGSESHSSDSDDDGVDSEDEHTAVAATGDS